MATHVYATGPGHALADYAATRAGRLVFIGQPFGYAPDVRPLLRRWRAGALVAERRISWPRHLPELVNWGRDLALTVYWGLRTPGTIDVFVGCDSLVAAAGLILRRVGKVERVVFWTIDYAPERFANPTLNRIYHGFDRLCQSSCDETWNLSPRMEEARAERGLSGRQRVVPMGATARPVPTYVERHRIVFLGHLLEKQGVQLVLQALTTVRQALPDARLLVIGDGPYRSALEGLSTELGLDDAVEFAGFVDDHTEVERLLAESGAAVAMYDPELAGYSHFADPGKIKTYLLAGLALVTTPVPHLAGELETAGCAIVVPYEREGLVEALLKLLSDPVRQDAYRARARAFGAQFDWPVIFDRALAPFAGPAAGAR